MEVTNIWLSLSNTPNYPPAFVCFFRYSVITRLAHCLERVLALSTYTVHIIYITVPHTLYMVFNM